MTRKLFKVDVLKVIIIRLKSRNKFHNIPSFGGA